MKERNILVFGGTIEGRRVSEYLSGKKAAHTLCVATEYGEEVLDMGPYMTVRQGRMNQEEMCLFMEQGAFCAVVDATHPYAVEVSKNIRSACEKESLPYFRYLRPDADDRGKEQELSGQAMVFVDSSKEAADYLEQRSGQIFLTTGSKELHVFTEVISDKSRLFVRVLPSSEVMASCRALGLEGKQICGMQGPFSVDMNEAMMRQAKAAFLVTKDTGISGGFPEKIEAARRLGVTPVVIRRPEETGYDWEELKKQLEKILGENQDDEEKRWNGTEQVLDEETIPRAAQGLDAVTADGGVQRKITCIGIGMGNYGTLTYEAANAIRQADILFGAKRILESTLTMWDDLKMGCRKPAAVAEYSGEKIKAYVKLYPEYRNIVVLMSGDVGFYSGARGIKDAFAEDDVTFLCGISSVVYFASKIPTSWQDAKLVSAHGKHIAVLNLVKRYPKLIMLVSGSEDVERICSELSTAGLHQVKVTVGSNLSYPQESILSGTPDSFLTCGTRGLHIIMVENPEACHVITPGIPDEEFVRGKVPMTKEEIRILSIAKLRLKEDAVVYDVGAGTGSVSIEAARLCTMGTVYAIEKNPEGIRLIRENGKKMGLSNLITVEGTAPEAMDGLPSPTHAFIGGSSGNMKQIIGSLLEKNPKIRIVINTIALESIAEVVRVLDELGIKDADIVQASLSKSKVLGRYHMMNGMNPVYIISFGSTL